MNQITNEMMVGYLALIIQDYTNWQNLSKPDGEIAARVRTEMNERFISSIRFETGRKYIKVISNGGVHSFIVNTTKDREFRLGDILKPAGFNAPARNFARGNLIDGTLSRVTWTGAI
jgi:hypothetical protein